MQQVRHDKTGRQNDHHWSRSKNVSGSVKDDVTQNSIPLGEDWEVGRVMDLMSWQSDDVVLSVDVVSVYALEYCSWVRFFLEWGQNFIPVTKSLPNVETGCIGLSYQKTSIDHSKSHLNVCYSALCHQFLQYFILSNQRNCLFIQNDTNIHCSN